MSLYALELIPWVNEQFTDDDGNPLSGGKVETYIAGTLTPLQTYTDVAGVTPHANPIVLNADGRAPSPIYLLPRGYKFIIRKSDNTVVETRDNVQNVGQVFAETFGNVLSGGSKDVTSGYTILDTDRLITVNSTGGPNPCIINLPSAATRTQPIGVKNVGTVAISLTPQAAQFIDKLAAAAVFTIPAAASPSFPTLWLLPDQGLVTWWIVASHKVP